MKKALVGILTLGLIIGLFGSSVGMGQKTLGTPQTNVSTTTIVNTEQELEEYVPKVIIEGKWGKGEDEFYQAYKDLPKNSIIEFKPVYRYSFDIDNEGNICVLTGSKILKYESNGKWVKTIRLEPPDEYYDIRIDTTGNIFVLFSPWCQLDETLPPPDWNASGMRVYDKNGELEGRHRLRAKSPELGPPATLYKDDMGNIWYEDKISRYPFYMKGKIYEEPERIKLAQRKKNESKDKKYHYVLFPKEDIFGILDNNDKLVNKVATKVDFSVQEKKFLSLDEEGNLYLGFNDFLFKNHEVHKYDRNGDFVCKVKMKPPYFERKLLYAPSRPVVIDKYGNIYQIYVSDREGVKIIKWEKVRSKSEHK